MLVILGELMPVSRERNGRLIRNLDSRPTTQFRKYTMCKCFDPPELGADLKINFVLFKVTH